MSESVERNGRHQFQLQNRGSTLKLAIFDVDGTLVNTKKVDAECFVHAFESEFSIPNIESNWTKYENPTDSGITQAIFQRVFNRPPDDFEIRRLKATFLRLLQDAHSSTPDLFAEIPGARSFFNFLLGHSEWQVAIATGGWHETAIFKLTSADFYFNSTPISTSDQAGDRESIVRSCIESARRYYHVDQFSKIVALGDSPWDVTTARALGLAFIGVGNKQQLSKLGATYVVKDYKDPDRLMELLELASVP